MNNLYHFLNLSGLAALLLGGIGVASAIHVHVKQKLGTVAVLRCLGASRMQTFAIYTAQGMALGVIGAVTGCALGVALQLGVARVVADFIPFTFEFQTSCLAIGRAGGMGFVLCLLFAWLPLLEVRRVSPLAALRQTYETGARPRDPLRWLAMGALGAGIVLFAITQGRNLRSGLGFCGGLLVAFLVLGAVARALTWAARRMSHARIPFAFRQGLANLHRPNNRTVLLLLSLGLGIFLILGIQLLQHTLLNEFIIDDGSNQPNAILFDIQPDQRVAVGDAVRSLKLPVLDELPLVTMRITSIKRQPVEMILSNKQSHVPSWILKREYRSTYTDHLRDAEHVVAGKWIGSVTNTDAPVPISVEKEIAKDLGVALGDEMIFDVQGVPVTTRVASLREVQWRRVQPNFFMLFPAGVLEGAPRMDVLVTRVNNNEQSAELQRTVAKSFPGVSVIDLTLILQTLNSILGKISFAIRFMALFTVATGVIVLVGALASGHFQRVQESVLLRTLGASRAQIFKILAVEYASLGLLAAATGATLALGADWAMTAFLFHVHFAPQWWPLAVALIAAPLMTTALGLVMSRRILNEPPLAILREGGG